jgi:15-cis-phytoene synthase
MSPLEYCQAKAAPAGSNAYYAVYFAEPAQRAALLAVLAIQAELVEIRDEVKEAGVARVKLNWWREELGRAFSGQARHPASQALQEQLGRFKLEAEPFEQMIEAVGMDLEYGSYPSLTELSLYCHRMGISLAQLIAAIGGYSDRGTLRFAHHLGMGLQLARLLTETRRQALAGRVYIPEDELAPAGVAPEQLLQARDDERLRGVFAVQAERIESFFDQAEAQLPDVDRWNQRSGLILAELDRALLAELRADQFPLLEKEYHLTPIRKLWIAWRTARRQKRYKRRSA